jgi:hypothetical protein
MRLPNQAAAVNAPVAPWFQFGHPWRRVTEQRRWLHEMSTWRYILSKVWLRVRHRNIRMSRCSFHSVGKGWLVNLSLPINRIAPNYTNEDVLFFHERLQVVALGLAWMLGPADAIQLVSGEDTTPRQFYNPWLKKNGRQIEMSERQTIHEAQQSACT